MIDLEISAGQVGSMMNKMCIDKLSMIKNIRALNITVPAQYCQIAWIIANASVDKMKKYKAHFVPGGNSYPYYLDPLSLMNTNCIVIDNLYYIIKWSNQCEKLQMEKNLQKIDEKWCNFLINNCDCGGVKFLSIDTCCCFKFKNNLQHEESIKLIKLFANKFTNLTKLQLNVKNGDFGPSIQLFWKLLNPTIGKQNTNVLLDFDECNVKKNLELCRTMENNQLKVNSLSMFF